MDGERIATALKGAGWPLGYIVLTVDPKDWPSPEAAYTGILACWRAFCRRCRKSFGKFQYVVVLEQHKQASPLEPGWPHLNAVVTGEFARSIYAAHRDVQTFKDYLKPLINRHAVRSGFGWVTWVEPVRAREAIGLYLGKLTGELTKESQVPVLAPKGFRRLRSSKGFLPPRRTESEWTGELVRRPLTGEEAAEIETRAEEYVRRRLLEEAAAAAQAENADGAVPVPDEIQSFSSESVAAVVSVLGRAATEVGEG